MTSRRMVESDESDASTSNDQWRVFLGIAMLIASYVFRVELVRFTLRLSKRALPGTLVWIKEFEKNLLLPLSWVVFVLLVWFSTYVMNLPDLLGVEASMIASLINLFLGFPLIWTVICVCNYVTWGIIRVKGWNRAASKEDDDYNRVMIISEGVGVIKILLVAYVISEFMFDGIGEITDFDSSQITTVAVLVIEFVFLFGSHTWLKNTMGGLIALIDEQVKSGSHVQFQGQEGVIERLFLQSFCVRRLDKSLVYIPNGLLLEHSVEIKTKAIDRRATVLVHIDHGAGTPATRRFIQELDGMMAKFCSERQTKRKSGVLGLEHKPRGRWDLLKVLDKAKALASTQDEVQKPRFWITIVAPFMIEVAYFMQEHHTKLMMAEKTELVLQITELMVKEGIRPHRHGMSVMAATSSEADEAFLRPLSPEPRTEPMGRRGRRDLTSDRFRRFASESNLIRQRRPTSALE